VESENMAQVSDADELEAVVAEVLAESPDQVETFQSGKTTVIGWFVGQVMRKSGGKANPQLVREILERMLNE
jgi:aspartyl-tRNA(Asn)/glutamyl-tRNA(Gln) amidotransferase subunit B